MDSGQNNASIAQTLKSFWDTLTSGEFAQAYDSGSDIFTDLFKFFGFADASLNIFNTLKNKELKPSQKIFPIFANLMLGTFSLAIGTIACAAITITLPPVIFVGSIIKIIRSASKLFEERAEMQNIKKFFASEKFQEQIHALNLPLQLKEDIKKSLQKKDFSASDIQNLLVRVSNHYINQSPREQEALQKLLAEHDFKNLNKEEKTLLRKQIKFEEKELKDHFQEKYKDLFALFKKRQRLALLKSNVKERLVSIGISLAVANMCLVAMGAYFAAMGPQVVAILAVVGSGMGVLSSVQSVRITLKSRQSNQSVNQPIAKIKETVFPSLEAEAKINPKYHEKAKVLYQERWWNTLKKSVQRWFAGSPNKGQKGSCEEDFIHSDLYLEQMLNSSLSARIKKGDDLNTHSSKKPITSKRSAGFSTQFSHKNDKPISSEADSTPSHPQKPTSAKPNKS